METLKYTGPSFFMVVRCIVCLDSGLEDHTLHSGLSPGYKSSRTVAVCRQKQEAGGVL